MPINKEIFSYLKQLSKNNNRDWFIKNKPEFDRLYEEIKEFYHQIGEELSKTDSLDKTRVHRIYRDVRFSANKTPYKRNFSGSFSRATSQLRGGYYLHLEPGASFIGGGFWGPNKEDLLRIRKEFEMDDSEIRKIIQAKKFQEYFGELKGEGVKTAPKGFDREHPAIDLIKKKQFVVTREFSDQEVFSSDFDREVIKTFKAMRPYFDYMSEVLTTDLNGESIL